MADRADLVAAFLDAAGWGTAARHPLAGDASARRYLRLLRAPGETAVLMDAPPDRCGDTPAFLAIGRHLLSLSLSAPRVLAEDATAGLVLLEDLGDGIFARLLAQDPAREPALYAAAAETLATLQAAPPPPGLTPFTPAHMAGLVRIAFEWYAPDTSAAAADTLVARLEAVLDAVAPRPTVLALRDVHAENLLWLPGRAGPARTGLLDFQDAVVAHPAYDLVSLLDDARRDVGAPARAAATRRFLDLTGHAAEPFAAAAAALSLQRNLRILGVFARLARRDGKSGYLGHVPRVRGHVLRALDHPALAGLTAPLFPILSVEAPCATPVP